MCNQCGIRWNILKSPNFAGDDMDQRIFERSFGRFILSSLLFFQRFSCVTHMHPSSFQMPLCRYFFGKGGLVHALYVALSVSDYSNMGYIIYLV